MTTTAVRCHDVPMTENPWARLHRIATARLRRIGLNQTGMRAAGGPTGGWLRALKGNEGAPSSRHAPHLLALDHALR